MSKATVRHVRNATTQRFTVYKNLINSAPLARVCEYTDAVHQKSCAAKRTKHSNDTEKNTANFL